MRYQLSGTEAGMPDPWRVLVTQSDFYSPHLGGQVQHNTYTSLYEQHNRRTIELNFLNQNSMPAGDQDMFVFHTTTVKVVIMYCENVPTQFAFGFDSSSVRQSISCLVATWNMPVKL